MFMKSSSQANVKPNSSLFDLGSLLFVGEAARNQDLRVALEQSPDQLITKSKHANCVGIRVEPGDTDGVA